MLVHARKPELVAGVFDRLNELQQKSGEVDALERREYQGQAYVRRHKKGDGDEFYFLRGPVLAFSDKEVSIRAAIDRDRQAPPVAAEPPALRRGSGSSASSGAWRCGGSTRGPSTRRCKPRSSRPAARRPRS